MGRLENPSVEHWIYALIGLQTTQGFLGAGNYGIARMNGGFSSRPCVAFAPSQDAGARFLRDLSALLQARESLIQDLGYAQRGALGFVWCAPWDGTKSLSIAELDPLFVEICRRVRLTAAPDGTIEAHQGSSKVARIAAKELNGNTGDGWTPVARKDGKALTMAETGFGYERVQDLLFGPWNAGAAGGLSQTRATDSGSARFSFVVKARRVGTTSDGFPCPPKRDVSSHGSTTARGWANDPRHGLRGRPRHVSGFSSPRFSR